MSYSDVVLVLLAVWIGFGFRLVPLGYRALILFIQTPVKEVNPGLYCFPLPFVMYRPLFPTFQLPIKLDLPVTGAEAELANYYTEAGERKRLKDFDETEQRALLDDPLNKRFNVVVETPLLLRFKDGSYGKFVRAVHDYEALGRNIGFGVKSLGQEILGSVTVKTMIERKEILARILGERLSQLALENEWPVEIVHFFVGEVSLNEVVAATLSERIRQAQEWLGRAEGAGFFERYMKTETGGKAAELLITHDIYQGAQKVVIAPGVAGALDTFKEAVQTI